jgi:hypothetical protein
VKAAASSAARGAICEVRDFKGLAVGVQQVLTDASSFAFGFSSEC